MELSEIRKRINELNDEMLDLFLERMQLSAEVAEYKKANGLPILDKTRERDILARMAEKGGAENETYVYQFFNTLMNLSKARQSELISGSSEIAAIVEKMGAKGEGKKANGERLEANGDKKVFRDFRDLRALAKNVPSATPTTLKSHTSAVVHSRTLKFERTLDLRGYRADEALEKLIAYMDDALMVGAGEILHGTGTGALKQLTRDYLNDLNRQRRKRGQVAIEFGDGDVNHGGAGLTIVYL